jgi:RNA polymerase sigma-70 factor (ECF subfamily)
MPMTAEAWKAPDPPPQGDPLEACLPGIRARDERALETLYRATCGRVYGLALRILNDRALAEEAALDVYSQVWREHDRFDPDKGTVAGWLWTLARTRAIDLRRSRARRTDHEYPLDAAVDVALGGESPEAAAGASFEAQRVRLAVARLPIEQRRAVLTAYFGGLSHRETAAALGEPLGTVKTRIRMGLESLRRDLGAAFEVKS